MRTAFSLIELLAVVALFAILAVLAIPAAQSVATSYRLSASGKLLTGLLERARLNATTTQRVSVVRLYADSAVPGFSTIQLLEWVPVFSATDATNNIQPLTRPRALSQPIIISAGMSSALTNARIVSGNGALPGKASVEFREFHFFPDGSTSLEATPVNPYFTIVASRDDINTPENPFVVSLDPVTGQTTVFQR